MNPENLAKIGQIDFEIIGRTEIVKNKDETAAEHVARAAAGWAKLNGLCSGLIRCYSAPVKVAEYGDDHVCLSVCLCGYLPLSACIFPELHVRASPSFCTLPMAIAPSSYGDVAICYVKR